MKCAKEKNHMWKILLIWACLLTIGYWVYAYHWQHALGFAPFLILLLCPLMHIFMHRDHQGTENPSQQEDKKKNDEWE